MPINWNDKDVLERLFVATLASLDNKINISEVARLYGQDMTYHALENRLRNWKKQATGMKNRVSEDTIAVQSPAKATPKSSAKATPKKGEGSPVKGRAVKTGRVVKAKAKTMPSTPVKIKTEFINLDDEETFADARGEFLSNGEEFEDEVDEFV